MSYIYSQPNFKASCILILYRAVSIESSRHTCTYTAKEYVGYRSMYPHLDNV